MDGDQGEPQLETIKSQVEEKMIPHIPSDISDSVSKNLSSTLELESVSGAVEWADSLGCSGIDLLTEMVPQLKDADATTKLLEETKVSLLLFLPGMAWPVLKVSPRVQDYITAAQTAQAVGGPVGLAAKVGYDLWQFWDGHQKEKESVLVSA